MGFIWDKGNLAHIAEHGVTAAEAEEVVDNDPLELEVQLVDGEERILQVGSTGTRRVLMAVTTWRKDDLRVVTMFPASPGFRQLYLREKGHGHVKGRDKDSQI
ncbi:MAG TPA: BrnT family toxin [Edaphobacter sp.]|nr:BrnT family toxin [Edaphobacter sp.]